MASGQPDAWVYGREVMNDVPLVLVERVGALATVTLNAPERRNVLSVAMLTAISDALAQVEADDSMRVVVLAHTGPVFCAGVDMKEASDLGLEASSGLILRVLRQI